jgi:membrane protein insertase Oxa1/YidC/SpoIIIJ
MSLIQIPVFIGLYWSVKDLADIISKNDPQMIQKFGEYIYSFLQPLGITPEIFSKIDPYFFGVNLLQSHNVIFAVLAGILMYIQMKFMSFVNPTKNKQQQPNIPGMPQMPDISNMMKMMNIFLVLMMIFFVWSMPAAIGLYIIVMTLFSIFQMIWQYWPLIKVRFFTK